MSAITGILRYTLPVDNAGSTPTVSLLTGTLATGYGLTYLTDFTDVNLGRPTLATTTTLTVQLDYGSATTLAGILVWHNLDDGLTMTIQGSNVAGGGSPAFTATVVVLAQRGDSRKRKLFIPLAQSYRYWVVKSPTNSVAVGFKVMPYFTVRSLIGLGTNSGGQQFSWGARRPNAQQGIDLATLFGMHWAYNFQVGAESLTGPIALSDTDLEAFKYWHQATGGRALSMFQPDSGSAEAWLTRMTLGPAPYSLSTDQYTSVMDAQLASPRHNIVTLSVEDMTAGGPEWL